MQDNISINAVVVNFNTGSRLSECIAALLEQTGIARIWLIDNASTDDSLENILKTFPGCSRLNVVRNKINRGFAVAVNQALLEDAGSDWLLLNPDCVLAPNTVSELRRVLDQDSRAGLVGPLIVNPDGTEQRGCRRELPDWRNSVARLAGRRSNHRGVGGFDMTGTPLPDHPTQVPAISGACMLVRGSALSRVGPLDENYFLHCEDLDWCRRFNESGWQVMFAPTARVVHHQGTSSRGRPVRVLWHKHRGMWRYHRKFDAVRTPVVLNSLIFAGIASRFLLLAVVAAVGSLFGRARG